MENKNEIETINYQSENGANKNASDSNKRTSEKPKIYLIYDFPDQSMIKSLKKHLEKEEFLVLEPNFSGSLMERRSEHEKKLISANIIIINYGRANFHWLKTKLLDILKAPGLGKSKPFIANAVYTTRTTGLNKESIRKYKANLIQEEDVFSPKSIIEFLNRAKKSYAAISSYSVG